MDLRATELCQLCHTWRTKVQSIPGSDDIQSWGPSEQQLLEAAVWKVTANWNEGDGEWQEGTGPGHDANDMPEGPDWEDVVDEDSDFEDSDFELFESSEAVAFADEYHGVDADHVVYELADYRPSLETCRYGSQSPNKRAREI